MDLDTLLRDTAAAPEVALRAWSPPTGGRRRYVTPLRVAVAGAVAAAALVLPTLSLHDGTAPAASASAAEALHRAAVAAGAQPDGGWQGARYWYSRSTYSRDGDTITREIWIGHHDQGILRDPGVDSRTMPLGSPAVFDNGGDWDSLWSLPTDPAALTALFRSQIHGAGPDPDSELFTWVGDYLRETPAPPKLRAALYEVAARIPGVTLVGPTVDSAGRPGIGISRGGEELIIDPRDGALLADDEGAGTGTATYLEQHASDTAPTPSSDFVVQADGGVLDTGGGRH